MVQRFIAFSRGVDEHLQIGARLLLADEFRQQLRPQGGVDVVVAFFGGNQAAWGCHGGLCSGRLNSQHRLAAIAAGIDRNSASTAP